MFAGCNSLSTSPAKVEAKAVQIQATTQPTLPTYSYEIRIGEK